MSIQSDRWIRAQAKNGMIVPFSEKQVREDVIVNATTFELEWEGFVTRELSKTTPLPARMYANQGLCQILIFRSGEPCEIRYADHNGKYQKQQGIVLPKL